MKDLFGPMDQTNISDRGLLGRRDHLTFKGNVLQGRHGWLRLTPAYSLYVVQELFKQDDPRGFVLDPFSGTGTTPLVCASLGIPCHAIDINPFLVWLGNLKVTVFHSEVANSLRVTAKQVVDNLVHRKDTQATWRPDIHAIEKWWNPAILQALADLFVYMDRMGSHIEPEVNNLLKIAFCRVLIQTANVSFGHQSMSFKKQAQESQFSLFSEGALPEPGPAIWKEFLAVVEEVATSLFVDQPRAEAKVYLGDSRNMRSVLPLSSYTKVVTSPPYPNRMSYIRELRPYMYWLGYLTNGRQAGELDWEAIGGTWGCATSLLNTWEPASEDTIPYAKFGQIVSAIEKNHRLLGRYVHNSIVVFCHCSNPKIA